MKRAGIVGLGLWVPEDVRRNDAWPESFTTSFREKREQRIERDFTHIVRRGVQRPYEELFVRHALPHDNDPFKGTVERRVAPSHVPTAHGDAAAVVRALENAAVDPGDVDVLMSSAVLPDRLAPSNGPSIQHLTRCVNAPGIGVETFCSSALAQLDLAAALVESGRAKFVVCVQSHQLNRANDMDEPSSPIFGDGSAAFVVGSVAEDRGLVHMLRAGDGSLAAAVTWAYKRTPGAAWWRDAEGPVYPGSDDPAAVREITRTALAFPIDAIKKLCSVTETPMDTVAAIAMIQPLCWYQAAVADGLGIPQERVPTTYASYAHLGGAGVVANLLEARRRGLLFDGATVILYAHGAGVTQYAALLRWSDRS